MANKGIDYQAPLYLQLRETILKKINDKEYLPGEKLPSEREMAEIYGINRMTVKNALRSLSEDGLLVKIQGKGTFVAKPQSKLINMNVDKERAQGFSAFTKGAGAFSSSRVLGEGTILPDRYITFRLDLEEGDEVYYLYRVRLAEDEPVSVEYCYIPRKDFPDAEKHNFANTSLYDYMESAGKRPVNVQQYLTLSKAAYTQAKLLNIPEDSPVYFFEFISRDCRGHIVEYTQSYIRCDRIVFNYKARREPDL